MSEFSRISIIGAGMFGYALASVYGKRHPGRQIYLHDASKEVVAALAEKKEHPIHFKGIKLPENVVPTGDIGQAVSEADIILLSVPAQHMRKAVAEIRSHISHEVVLVDLAKALESSTAKRMSEVIKEELSGIPHKFHAGVLAGGMLAGDVISSSPVCAELALDDPDAAQAAAEALTTPNIRVYINTDLIGVELAGAFKNVVAIAAGMFDGLFSAGWINAEPAISSKAGLVSRASKEVKKLAMSIGASPHTFDPGSQAWGGDLMTTCFGNSRNRQFGELVVKMGSVEAALDEMKKQNRLVEGYATAKVLFRMCIEKGIECPVCENVYRVLYEGKNPKIAAAELMSKPIEHISS